METSTTIRRMMAGNKIVVPSYQRAYSWDTSVEKSDKNLQVDIFLSDLEEYKKSNASAPYYFGHFLFEEKSQEFFVIDGQQRLTTIVIFLSCLFSRLREIRELNEEEDSCEEDMIRRKSVRRFATVDYDRQLFIDYVIEKTKTNHVGLETESARRIVKAFDFFKKNLSKKTENYLVTMLSIIGNSVCSTHPVKSESEAIQMFIFQNNRGKRPSNLEIVKAQFMYNVHLYGGEEKDTLIDEIKNRFEKIYKSIALIEHKINEDDILLYTLRVYFNSLWEANAPDRINKEVERNAIEFIKNFTHSLSMSFEHLSNFFGKDEQKNFEIHSLVTLGGIAIALPFVIKAYKYGLSSKNIGLLCSSLESLVLRHRLIGTRAEMTSRINDVFEKFTEKSVDIFPIVERINYLKTTKDHWWNYWNNENLEESLKGKINSSIAKYLLWKYEIYLEDMDGKGYSPTRYNKIVQPELEHIAPKTEPQVTLHGYDVYDDDFKNQYLDCLGNYLLLSKSHNCAVGNIPFKSKLATYLNNKQQREISEFTKPKFRWTKGVIKTRNDKIISVIMNGC